MRETPALRAPLAIFFVSLLLASGALMPTAVAQETYYQPVVATSSFRPVSMDYDVLIVPPAHGQIINGNGPLNGMNPDELNAFSSSYIQAIEDAIDTWREAIDHFGSEAINQELEFNVYVVGRDVIPPTVLFSPDVVYTVHEFSSVVLGFAFRGFMLVDGPCWASNAAFGSFGPSFTYEDMYNVAAHEFGHCLGLSHVSSTDEDMMYASYRYTIGASDNPLYCVSNLNVKGVESAFQHLWTGDWGPNFVSVPAEEYAHHPCQK